LSGKAKNYLRAFENSTERPSGLRSPPNEFLAFNLRVWAAHLAKLKLLVMDAVRSVVLADDMDLLEQHQKDVRIQGDAFKLHIESVCNSALLCFQIILPSQSVLVSLLFIESKNLAIEKLSICTESSDHLVIYTV